MAASSDARPDSSMTLHLQMKLHTMDEAINAFIRLLYGEFSSVERFLGPSFSFFAVTRVCRAPAGAAAVRT